MEEEPLRSIRDYDQLADAELRMMGGIALTDNNPLMAFRLVAEQVRRGLKELWVDFEYWLYEHGKRKKLILVDDLMRLSGEFLGVKKLPRALQQYIAACGRDDSKPKSTSAVMEMGYARIRLDRLFSEGRDRYRRTKKRLRRRARKELLRRELVEQARRN